ncbi:MAG: MFS transporter [Saprospiraceae bacterium]
MLFKLFSFWRDSYSGISKTIWFLSFVTLINRCGAMVVAFMTVYLTQKLEYSIADAGYVMGFFGVGALLGSYLGGWLTDRAGYLSIQIWSLVGNGIMLLLILFLEDFWLMCFAVLLLSTISESFRPANSVAISVHSTVETRTRSISLYRMAINLGWTVAPALGGLLAALGWHWLFIVDGLTCLLAALLLYVLIVPKKEAATQLEHEKQSGTSTPAPSLANPYRDRVFLTFCGLTIINAMVFMQILWTVPVFFKDIYMWSEAKIGMVAAVNGLIVFLVEVPFIYRIDGRRHPMNFVRRGLILYGLSYAALLLPTAVYLIPAVLFMVIISFGEMLVMPFSTNYVFDRAQKKGGQGKYMAAYSIAYSIAHIVAPLMGTQIIQAWGFNALWAVLVVLSAIALIGFYWLEKKVFVRDEAPVIQAVPGV